MSNLHPEDLAELAWRDNEDEAWRAEEDPNLDIEPEIRRDAERKRWHRDVHKAQLRAALGEEGRSGV